MAATRNIIFIGGIHGVGKGSISKKICDRLKIEHFSASEVLKWDEINSTRSNKSVDDLNFTQDRLIKGLPHFIKDKNQIYLLDGHYCLMDSSNQISTIPLETFEKINPLALVVITDEVTAICQRLEARDKKIYDCSFLQEMQLHEIEHATFIAKKMNLKILVCGLDNPSELENFIKPMIQKT